MQTFNIFLHFLRALIYSKIEQKWRKKGNFETPQKGKENLIEPETRILINVTIQKAVFRVHKKRGMPLSKT